MNNNNKCYVCLSYKELKEFRKERNICKACHNKRWKDRQGKMWDRLMIHIGGQKCSNCNFIDEYKGCFDFHHIVPSTKNKDVSRLLLGTYEAALKEVNKCILLCANCHRKAHRVNTLNDLKEITEERV